MKRAATIAALAAGVLICGVGLLFAPRPQPPLAGPSAGPPKVWKVPEKPTGPDEPQKSADPEEPSLSGPDLSRADDLERAKLSEELFGRLARTMIADTRSKNYPLKYGVSFYDTPKPYGGVLCRVNRYSFPTKVVRGRSTRNEYWDDDLKIETLYGVWKRPSDPDNASKTRESECPRYRDFDHLIRAKDTNDVLGVERAVNLVDAGQRQALEGRVNFKLTCQDRRRFPKVTTCDGMAILRELGVKRITSVRNDSETKSQQWSRRADYIEVTPPPGSVATSSGCAGGGQDWSLKIDSIQRYGKQSMFEGELEALEIDLDQIC